MASPKSDDETNLRGKGKGKDEARDESPSSSSKRHHGNPDAEDESMTSRIAASASRLGASLLRDQPRGDEISQIASTGKERGVLSGIQTRNGEGSSSRLATSPRTTGDQFRESTTKGRAPTQEHEFSSFLSDTATVAPSPPVACASYWTMTDAARQVPPADIARQEMRDGSAVVGLLSGPGEEDLDLTQAMSSSEEELASLRSALFGASSASEWDHMLNFIPDFIRPDDGGTYADTTHGTWKADETSSMLGLPHSAESARIWIEQWQDVLARYTDEVWGDLGLLVREAQAEVDKLEKQNATEPLTPTTALLRLRQILQHVRGG